MWGKIFSLQSWLMLVGFAGLIILLYLGYLGFYTHPLADDFAIKHTLVEQGFFGSQIYWYANWSGRFSFTFLMSLWELSKALKLIPLVYIISWYATTVWALGKFMSPRQISIKWLPHALASIFITIFFLSIDNLGQSLLWYTGAVTYLTPIILWTLLLGLLAKLWHKKDFKISYQQRLAIALLLIIAGGFSEVIALVQIIASFGSGAWLLAIKYRSLKNIKIILGITIAASLISLLIVSQAPGNAVRAANFNVTIDIYQIITLAIKFSWLFVQKNLFAMTVTSLLTVLVGFIVATFHRSLTRKAAIYRILFTPVVMYILVFICFIPSLYAIGTVLPSRAFTIPQFIFTVTASYWGYVLGNLFISHFDSLWNKYKVAMYVLLVINCTILFVYVGTDVWRNLVPVLSIFKQNTLAFQENEKRISSQKESGNEDIQITPYKEYPYIVSGLGALEASKEANYEVNLGLAKYYQVRSIVVE